MPSNSFIPLQKRYEEEIQCYIYSVPPVQTTGDVKYFNYQVQTKEKVVHGVSFSRGKQTRLHCITTSKSPTKIKNYRKSIRFNQESFVIHNHTLLKKTNDIQFECSEQIDTTGIIAISQLSQVAIEQLVNIKAKVVNLT